MAKIKTLVIGTCGAEVLRTTKVVAARKRAQGMGGYKAGVRGSTETWILPCPGLNGRQRRR